MTPNPKIFKTYKIGKTPICITNMQSILSYITKNIKHLQGTYITFVNAHTAVFSNEVHAYEEIQNAAAFCMPDGQSVTKAMHILGVKEAGKVSGPDFMEEILKLSPQYGWKHYFYGSTEETLKRMEANYKIKYPGLRIAGMYSPPFRMLTEEEDAKIITQINSTNSDFIWVGLGAPKQEIWMYQHKNKINGLMLGVGAAFDFTAGTLKRAPKWMQSCGLEWFYRLLKEPKRLFKRYFVTNTKFIFIVLKELLH